MTLTLAREIYWFTVIPIKMPMAFFFHRTKTKYFKICMEQQNTLNIQTDLKKEQSWRHHTPFLQTILQKYSNQNSMVLCQRLKQRPNINQRYRIYNPEKKPMLLQSISLYKGGESIQGGKESLLINVGKIRQLYTKNKTGPFSYTMCKTRIKID